MEEIIRILTPALTARMLTSAQREAFERGLDLLEENPRAKSFVKDSRRYRDYHRRVRQLLTYLRKGNVVLRAHQAFASFCKQAVNHVLELLLRLRYLLSLFCRISITALQHCYNAVAYIHLIVKILALQLVYLPVKLRIHRCIYNLVNHIAAHQWAVETANMVIAYPARILWKNLNMHTT